MKTHSSGTTVIHLKTKDLAGFMLQLPDLSEQKRIAVLLGEAEAVSDRLREESNWLQAVRGRLLSGLLSREIEMPDSYDALLTEAV